MYEWRQMTARQREEALRVRRQCRRPWHSPPHFPADFPSFFHLSAACYNHVPLIGQTPSRMAEFENALLEMAETCGAGVRAWCILPNHWHALVRTADLKTTIRQVGQMHGRLRTDGTGKIRRRAANAGFAAATGGCVRMPISGRH